MIEYIFAGTVLALCLILVYFLYFTISSRAKKAERELNRLAEEYRLLQHKQLDYVKNISELSAELRAKDEQLIRQKEELIAARVELNKDFQILANKILEEKTEKFTDANKQNIEAILKPLNEKLGEFKLKVEETYDKESKQRFSLEERIKELVALNNQISEDANNLTKALKGDSKIQGDWGEMILESILEKSGLKKGSEYYSQEFITDEQGNTIKGNDEKRMKPDVIVAYPGGRNIVIDSKVSLSAYVKYIESETDVEREKFGKEHVASVRRHIDGLSKKSYQDYVDSLDFVMMFVPNESAYILAMQLDSDLWDDAYNKRMLLISPTNLIASLKVVADLWKREHQSENAQAIAERGTLLYEKFVGFVESLLDLGKSLDKSQKSYEQALSQLSEGKGNLMRQAEMLKELGVKTKKDLPESLKS